MQRILLIKIHLYLSGISLIFLSIMAISGSMHLLIGNEAETTEVIKTIDMSENLNQKQLTDFFKSQIQTIDPKYKYDYIKGSDTSQMTRPTTREYYTIKILANSATIQRHSPSILKRMMEFHKGHGPRASRNILGILGIITFGAVLSGLWLGWTSKALRKITLLTSVSGTALILVLFLL